ncbi:MAG: hypothetical protein NZ937_06685 [Armatimonadetes bacterium]|nr:hypothetical protein [Armatimonadota bacterium]
MANRYALFVCMAAMLGFAKAGLLSRYEAKSDKDYDPSSLFQEALQVVKASKRLDRYDRSMILAEIALNMVEFGLFERAVKVAKDIGNEEYRALAYGDIAAEVSKRGKKKQAHSISVLALKTAMAIKETNYRLTALSKVAFRLADAGFYDLALRAAKIAKNESIVRSKIVDKLAKEGKFEQAKKMAETIGDVSFRLSALKSIALEMARAGMKQQASQVLDEMLKILKEKFKDPIDAVMILREGAEGIAKAGMKEQAKEIFALAVQVAQDIKPEPFSSLSHRAFPELSVVVPLISTMADVGLIDEALESVEKLAKSKSLTLDKAYPQVLHHISVKVAETNQIERALELVSSINHPYHKAISLAAIARVIAIAETARIGTK